MNRILELPEEKSEESDSNKSIVGGGVLRC